MRYAVISDIHANLEALAAVLKDIEKQSVDQVICLGDVIGYGVDPVPCIDLVEKHCAIKLKGNHEAAALGEVSTDHYNPAARISAEWTRAHLTDTARNIISAYVMEHEEPGIYFVHASPLEPTTWRYVLNVDEAGTGIACMPQRIGFNGHTHLPMIFASYKKSPIRQTIGHSFCPDPETRYLVNVGAVGQPRDNDPRASYAIFDTVEEEITFRRIEYDVKTTQDKMIQAELPELLIARLSAGR
jgi:diadenosine tetraphosphatase ApaH/serine/threonine PP2A family protein phosphatase